MNWNLNDLARAEVETLLAHATRSRVAVTPVPGGGRVVDCGVAAEGGLAAGLALARICLAGLAEVALVPGECFNTPWPQVSVTSDHPVPACLLSQYAGWQISVGKYFAMGSGPMRAAAAREDLFQELSYRESPAQVVGVLETRKLPGPEVLAYLAERTGVPAEGITLLVAPTASLAGTVQVVARSVETALHKLHALGFDLSRIRSAHGVAPLAPVARNDLAGIGRTNDAILYGGRVTLYVKGDDESLRALGPRVPANSSPAHGEPFAQIFARAGHDFYKIDSQLFSPAEVVFQNLDTGKVQVFGHVAPGVLRQSFLEG